MRITLENPLVLVELFSGVIGVLLSLHFITDRNKTNRYLGGFLFITSIEIIVRMFDGCASAQFPYLKLFFPAGFPFLDTLFLYLYIRNLTGTPHSGLRNYKYFLIPGFLHIVFSLWLFAQGTAFKNAFLKIENLQVYGLMTNFALYTFNFYFLILSLKLIRQHQQNIREVFSELEHKTLTWLRVFTWLLLATNTVCIVEDLILIPKESPSYAWYTASIVLTFFTIVWVGRQGLRQSEVFKAVVEDDEAPMAQHQTKAKPMRDEVQSLTDKEEKAYETLVALMEKKKLYTQLELTLQQVAAKLDIREVTLTKIIKSKTHDNFHSFINQYRVEEVKRLLSTDERYILSIRGIAYKAGFKSKSTFYTAFKKFEKMTPSAYLQQQEAQATSRPKKSVVVSGVSMK